MLQYLYRIYRKLPLGRRIQLVRAMERASAQSTVVHIIWNNLIMRYHYLYGAPRGLTVELTDKCNLKCTYCPKSLDIGVKGGHMAWEVFVKAIDGGLEEGRLDVVNLVGFGEPFLYPELSRAIRYIKDKDPRIRVHLTSNGTLLNKQVAKTLIDAGLDQLTISVNATSREQYRRINAADEYDRVVKNTIDFLSVANASDRAVTVLVQVLSVVNDEEQIAQFREFWRPYLGKYGVIQVQPFVNWAGQIDTADILRREAEAREAERRRKEEIAGDSSKQDRRADAAKMPNSVLLRALKSRKRNVASPFEYDAASNKTEPYPCYHLHKTRIISREGNALACCMVFPEEQGDLALGNLQDKSFAELYGAGKLRELQRIDLNGRLDELVPCKTCDAWKTVPNIWWRNPFHRWFGPKWF